MFSFYALFSHILYFYFFFFNDTSTTVIYTLSLHDALPISYELDKDIIRDAERYASADELKLLSQIITKKPKKLHVKLGRSEEHTSELQSRFDLVCRLLLEKKKKKKEQIKLKKQKIRTN